MVAVDPDRLTDEQWARLSGLMPGRCKSKRGQRLYYDWIERGVFADSCVVLE